VIDYLEEQNLKLPCRIYGAVLAHHVWSYYTGLPIQSIAPVRRSFLEKYPHTIIYLDNPWTLSYPVPGEIKQRAEEVGIKLNDEEVAHYRKLIFQNFLAETVEARGLDVSPEARAYLPEYLRDYPEILNEKHEKESLNAIAYWKK
jgi:hypothetical protein